MTVCCTTVCSPSLLAINMGSVACKVVLKHNGICRYSLRHCEPVYDVKLSRRKCGAKASLVQRRTFLCVCGGGGSGAVLPEQQNPRGGVILKNLVFYAQQILNYWAKCNEIQWTVVITRPERRETWLRHCLREQTFVDGRFIDDFLSLSIIRALVWRVTGRYFLFKNWSPNNFFLCIGSFYSYPSKYFPRGMWNAKCTGKRGWVHTQF